MIVLENTTINGGGFLFVNGKYLWRDSRGHTISYEPSKEIAFRRDTGVKVEWELPVGVAFVLLADSLLEDDLAFPKGTPGLRDWVGSIGFDLLESFCGIQVRTSVTSNGQLVYVRDERGVKELTQGMKYTFDEGGIYLR